MEVWKDTNLADLDGEVWKPIQGYEGMYEVSNYGRLKCFAREWYQGNGSVMVKRRTETKIYKQSLDKNGYCITSLRNKEGKWKSHRFHRIVAETFIPNPENKETVNHINGIKNDNRVCNLEFATPKEQVNHAFRIGINSNNVYSMHEVNKQSIRALDLKTDKEIKRFDSILEASDWLRELGKTKQIGSISSLGASATGKDGRKQSFGFRWEYIDKGDSDD